MSIILDKNRGRKRPLNRSIKKKGPLSICQTREGRFGSFVSGKHRCLLSSRDCRFPILAGKTPIFQVSLICETTQTPCSIPCPTAHESSSTTTLQRVSYSLQSSQVTNQTKKHQIPSLRLRGVTAAANLHNSPWLILTFAEQIGCLPYANWVNGRASSDIPCSATA